MNKDVVFDPATCKGTFENTPQVTLKDVPVATLTEIITRFEEAHLTNPNPITNSNHGYIFPKKVLDDLLQGNKKGLVIRFALDEAGALDLVFIPIEKIGNDYEANYDEARTTYVVPVPPSPVAITKDPILCIPPNQA